MGNLHSFPLYSHSAAQIAVLDVAPDVLDVAPDVPDAVPILFRNGVSHTGVFLDAGPSADVVVGAAAVVVVVVAMVEKP